MSLYCDTEAPDFYVTTEPKARKVHGCCECKAPIHHGEKYLSVSAKWDGVIERLSGAIFSQRRSHEGLEVVWEGRTFHLKVHEILSSVEQSESEGRVSSQGEK